MSTRIIHTRLALLAASLLVTTCTATACTTVVPAPPTTASHPASPAMSVPAATGSPGMSGMGSGQASGFSSSSLAQSIGRGAGTRLAGLAPRHVTTAQARLLAERVPPRAGVDKAANTVTLTGAAVSLAVVAVLPGAPDMTFMIAGLVNPTVVVSRGATVTVEFINADTDEAHGWVVTSRHAPFTFGQSMAPAIAGARAGLIGDPTASGDGARGIRFTAGPAGTYTYLCPMPGHAQMGMHGAFIVR